MSLSSNGNSKMHEQSPDHQLIINMMGRKILIIDDDADLLQMISLIFKKTEAQVFTAFDGPDGLRKLYSHRPDLIILDVMLPDMDGYEVCRRIRQVSDIPVILLTVLSQEKDMLQGLGAGADDFLLKPFSAQVLLARAGAVLRRYTHLIDKLTPFEYNDGYLSIDTEGHRVLIMGNPIPLTRVEFHLLVYLVRNAGKILTFEQILSNVWGNQYLGNMDYVHVYVSHLRVKLEEKTKAPHYISTVHGIGYRFEKHDILK